MKYNFLILCNVLLLLFCDVHIFAFGDVAPPVRPEESSFSSEALNKNQLVNPAVIDVMDKNATSKQASIVSSSPEITDAQKKAVQDIVSAFVASNPVLASDAVGIHNMKIQLINSLAPVLHLSPDQVALLTNNIDASPEVPKMNIGKTLSDWISSFIQWCMDLLSGKQVNNAGLKLAESQGFSEVYSPLHQEGEVSSDGIDMGSLEPKASPAQGEPVVEDDSQSSQISETSVSVSNDEKPADNALNNDLQSRIKAEFPNLSDDALNKLRQLIKVIQQDETIDKVGLLMRSSDYQKAKDDAFPGGLPDGVSSKSLFELSRDAQNDQGSNGSIGLQASDMQSTQLKKSAEFPEVSSNPYQFDSVAAMMKAQSQVEAQAENVVKQSLAQSVENKFDKNAWTAQFKSENQDEVNQSGFDEVMQQNMEQELQSQIDQAYEDYAGQITAAGKTAVAEFKSKVDQAAKANKLSTQSQAKSIKSNQEGVTNAGVLNKVKSDAVKNQKSIINQQVDQQFINPGYELQVPRDNKASDTRIMTKDMWIKSYKLWHPKATQEEVSAKLNEVIATLQNEAYNTSENKIAIKNAQDQAVAAYQAQQTQSAPSIAKSMVKSMNSSGGLISSANVVGRPRSPVSVASSSV